LVNSKVTSAPFTLSKVLEPTQPKSDKDNNNAANGAHRGNFIF
jgi:hypothetical protein